MSITSSQAQNITSPSGNSLAVFVDGVTGVMMLKDINGRTEPLSNYVCGGGGGNTSPFEYNANGTGIQPILGGNTASSNYATIGGGLNNTVSSAGYYATIGGGVSNTVSNSSSTISGGRQNIVSGSDGIIGGGRFNTISFDFSTIGGGLCNTASNILTTVGGGYNNTASGVCSSVFGGYKNTSSGACSSILGGCDNTALGLGSVTVGGFVNFTKSEGGVTVGGYNNCSLGQWSFIGGGKCNMARCCNSIIIAGLYNDTCTFCDVVISGNNLCATQNCATFMNCASVDNLTSGCVVRVGTNKVLENSDSKIGSFFSTQTQCATTINTPKAMTLNNTDAFSSGVTIVSNSQITVDATGIYNLQFSAQIDRVSGSGLDTIDIWYRLQGVDAPNTNTKITIAGNVNESKIVASWNFFISLTAGQYVELMYSVTDLEVQILYETANLIIPHPATPSLIVTIQKIN